MKDIVMGQCAICGGSFTHDHRCPTIYSEQPVHQQSAENFEIHRLTERIKELENNVTHLEAQLRVERMPGLSIQQITQITQLTEERDSMREVVEAAVSTHDLHRAGYKAFCSHGENKDSMCPVCEAVTKYKEGRG